MSVKERGLQGLGIYLAVAADNTNFHSSKKNLETIAVMICSKWPQGGCLKWSKIIDAAGYEDCLPMSKDVVIDQVRSGLCSMVVNIVCQGQYDSHSNEDVHGLH